MIFVDKNPEESAADAGALPDPSQWEHRIIQNIVWSRHRGYVADTVIIGDEESNDSETYFIDLVLLQMIRDSPHNTRKIKSKLIANNRNTPQPVARHADSENDDDNSDSQTACDTVCEARGVTASI